MGLVDSIQDLVDEVRAESPTWASDSIPITSADTYEWEAPAVRQRDPLADIQLFLTTLFEPDDVVTTRIIETWDDDSNGKKVKRSKVVQADHHTLKRLLDRGGLLLSILRDCAEENKANMFFGVCPRGA